MATTLTIGQQQQLRRSRLRGAARPTRPGGDQLRLDAPYVARARPAAPAAPSAPNDRAVPAPHARGAEQRVHDGPTLDELLVGVWEGLSVGEEVTCPVCRAGALAPEAADGRRAQAMVRCPACASRLAR